MPVPRKFHARRLRTARQQSRRLHVVAAHRLTNFFKHHGRILVMKRFPQPQLFQLMRQNAQQIEVTPWTHHFRALAQHLNFARSVGDCSVLFVS